MDRDYFEWLKSIVDPFDSRGIHDILFRVLFDKEYYALIPNDNNRIADALQLRYEFYHYVPDDPYFPNMNSDEEQQIIDTQPCTILEFLISVAKRLNYICSEGPVDMTSELFWEMLGNVHLGFEETYDMNVDEHFINHIHFELDKVLERQYAPNGEGNLFPLKNPPSNQRNQEVWYQMNAYAIERGQNSCVV